MLLHEHFEWDDNKARQNLRKHRVSFGDAVNVLADEAGDLYHVEEFDQEHSNEEER